MADTQSKIKRSRLSPALGHFLAIILTAIFIALYLVGTYQVDFWRIYFFEGLRKLSLVCDYRVGHRQSAEEPFSFASTDLGTVRLPHTESVFSKYIRPPQQTMIEFECPLETEFLKGSSGVSYLNLGWIYGDETEVLIDGSPRSFHNKSDKVSIPLNASDIRKGRVNVTIRVSTIENGSSGVVGNAPIAISSGTKQNSKILGLSFALQSYRSLFHLMPVVTMSIFLILSWISGLRSRLTVVTFLYFATICIRNIGVLMVDFWPWEVARTYTLYRAFDLPVQLSFLIFSMELLGVLGRLIPKLLAGFLLLLVVQITYYLSAETSSDFVMKGMTQAIVFAILSSLIFVKAFLNRRVWKSDTGRNRVNRVFLIALAFYPAVVVLDHVLRLVGISLWLNYKMDVIMPLFIGGTVFYALSLIEKNYQTAKAEKEKMQTRLELGRAVQELLLPKNLHGRHQKNIYEFFYEPAEEMAGDWLSIWDTEEGETRFIIGDVTGKGPQAALAVSVIASVIDECKKRQTSMEECIRVLHERLLQLFKGRVGTTLSAAIVKAGNDVELYNCGAIGWLLVGKTNSLSYMPLRSSGLGSKAEIMIERKTVEYFAGDILLSFTDGVLEGSRALKSFQRCLSKESAASEFNSLKKALLDAGKDHVLEDDKTIIMLKHVG